MLNDISLQSENNSIGTFFKGGQTYSTGYLYLKHLPKYRSGVFTKAIVGLTPDISKVNTVLDMLNVVEIIITFDFQKYAALLGKYEKKKMLLDALHEGMIRLANNEGWEKQPLENAYNCCLEKNLEHKWLRRDKYFLSPDRKYYAGVFCDWDIDKFETFSVFLNKQKEEIKRVKLYEREPWDVDPMGKMGWDKETGEFYLYSKDERNKWTTSPIIADVL